MKLYTFPASPNSIKVMAVANHVGVQLDVELVDLTAGASKTPEFMKMNPNGKIPVLVDGDFILWESAAIMQYVASKGADKTLWPSDPQSQADVSRWMFWSVGHWGPACGTLLFERMVKGMLQMGAPDPKEEERGTMLFQQFGKVLDDHLAGRTWLVGDKPTLADFSVASLLFYAPAARLPWENFKHIQAYWQRFSELGSVQKALPQMPAGMPK